MSVTFSCPDAPRKDVPCSWCVEAKERGEIQNAHGGYCDPFCRGFFSESVGPEPNFANGNARALFDILGADGGEELYGSWSVEEIPVIRRRITTLRNSEGGRKLAVWDPSELKSNLGIRYNSEGEAYLGQGPRIINCGSTDEQVLRRLENLDQLLIYAQEHNFKVSWS